MPACRTKTEHAGIVSRALFDAESGDFAILALTDGNVVLVNDPASRFAPSTLYRFLGRWEESDRGPRFRASTWVADSPVGKSGVVRWLAEHCDGVGPATAEKLWAAYGRDAVRVVREEPERVVADRLLDEPTARAAAGALARVAGQERTRLELFELFNGKGFPRATVNRCVGRWGAKAPAVVKADPFRLLTAGLPGCGWQRCDRLYLDLGGNRARLKRQAVAAWAAVRDDRSGSTWVPASVAIDAIKAAVPNGADPIKALRVAIRAGRLRLRREGADRWLAVADRARAEQRVADAVRRLAAGPCEWPTVAAAAWLARNTERSFLPAAVEAIRGGEPSAHQLDELGKAAAGPVGCFTGGPGTGKTHTLAWLLRAIVDEHGPDAVAVAAPTGKAAKRATESLAARGLPMRATTIHSLLGVAGGEAGGWKFTHHRDNPLPFRFVVVDESSMIDASLLADLLDACQSPDVLPATPEIRVPAGDPIPPACRRCGRPLTNPDSWASGYGPECRKRVPPDQWQAVAPTVADGEVVISYRPAMVVPGTHVLFVGDPYQLPPVGHGAPLRDLIASGAVGVGELTEVRRNSGTIVRACAAIKAGRPADFDARFDLDADDPANLRFIPADQSTVLDVLEDVLGKLTRFDPVVGTQVIVPLNEKSPLSRKAVNERLVRLLNPAGRRVNGCPYAVGDKIICLKNGKLKAVRPADGSESVRDYPADTDSPDAWVANGEGGRVVAVGPKQFVAEFDGGRLALVPVGAPPKHSEAGDDGEGDGGSAGNFDLAYAITVHKSQGSEWPLVVALCDPAGGAVADRHFWYTALSRGKTAVLVIGDPAAFAQQCGRASLARRKTYLAELIRGDAEASADR